MTWTFGFATLTTTPQDILIRAPNVTTGTGSALTLSSGTGSVQAGALTLQVPVASPWGVKLDVGAATLWLGTVDSDATHVTNLNLAGNSIRLGTANDGLNFFAVSGVTDLRRAGAVVLATDVATVAISAQLRLVNQSAPATPSGASAMYSNAGHTYAVNSDGDTFQVS